MRGWSHHRRALRAANRLVGNPDNAAGFECTLMGPRFTVDQVCAIAVTGGEATVTVNDASAPQWACLDESLETFPAAPPAAAPGK